MDALENWVALVQAMIEKTPKMAIPSAQTDAIQRHLGRLATQ
jgi:hypothetical protein